MHLSVSFVLASVLAATAFADPCADISSSKWVTPKQVRDCFKSFKVDQTLKANTLDVVNKTIAFHTSVNYQVRAPAPFTSDVHEDLHFDLARIGHSPYPSEFDFHIDLSRSFKRLNDGHCVYINNCYDSVFLTYLPTPLVLLTDSHGAQSVHIAPEAFTVASREFADNIDAWQNALPGKLKGKLESLSGAKVLLIDGLDPFVAVEANAAITGSYQSHATRQNSFFSSYNRAASGWNYIMGNFAQMSLPLKDSVTLFVQRVNSTVPEFVTLPYLSRKNVADTWTDSASYRTNLCTAQSDTNGVDVYANTGKREDVPAAPAAAKFEQQPDIAPADRKKHAINVILDTTPMLDVVLPPTLAPQAPLSGSNGVAQFYLLDDKKTGVLALGSFSASSFSGLQKAMLDGLVNLKSQGASQLIVDVTNNGGGFICLAHWLHRIIVGPAPTTEPQAGLDTETRAGPLAQLIVKTIIADPSKVDPEAALLYNPVNWAGVDSTGAQTQFNATADWLEPLQKKVINGRQDAFSPRMSDICQPFDIAAPSEQLFDPKKVVIVSNGRCASSCSLFSITMAKKQGSKTIVLGGKKGVQQQYCGTVGGQSTDFSTIDTEVKTSHLKNNTLAPPDFLTNSVQGITWRLGFGVTDPAQPEEWQDHPADANLPLTADIVNNPTAIWNTISKQFF